VGKAEPPDRVRHFFKTIVMSQREQYEQLKKQKIKEMAVALGLENLLCNGSFFTTLSEMVAFNMHVNY